MKRIVLALLVGSALITSCGSNKNFTKKRHSHRNWVKVGEYTDSEFAQAESLETEKEVVTVAIVETPTKSENHIAANVDKIENVEIAETPIEANIVSTKTVVETETVETVVTEIENNDVQELSAPIEKENETQTIQKKRKKRGGGIMGLLEASTILLIILAILIPPLAVGLYEGITTRFWISLLLTLLFFLPGMIYALLIVTGTI